MRIIWLVSVCTAASWCFLISTFTPADISPASPMVFILAVGIIAASISLRKTVKQGFPPEILLFGIPLVLLCVVLPMPYSLGAMIMLAGLAFNIPAGRLGWLAPISAACLLTGLILLVQSACMPIFYIAASRIHEIKLLNQIAYPLIKLLGLKASMSESVIYLPSFQNLTAFPGTLEKTGFYLLFQVLVSGPILIWLFDGRWKTILRFVGVCAGYALFRYVFLIFVMAQVISAELYWHPFSLVASFVPLAGLLIALFPLREPVVFPKDINVLSVKTVGAALLFFASVFCFVGACVFEDPGVRKQGRILIDELHSDWEWSTRKFDTTWFGSRSTYNYYCLADYLNHFYTVKQNTDQKLTPELLSNYDVLVLKTPTKPYGEDEITAVVEFVEKGGGLWLIGDHTNVFGMDYYLNFVAKHFGLFFHYDSTYDLDKGTLTYYERPKVFPHPIVQNMPPFLFATSDTLGASFSAENVMVGYGLRTRLLAYAERGFFQKEPSQDYEFGLFLQAAGTTYGKGRVAAFTDSTCFSNFYMFIPGKPELAMGYVEWLNRANRYGFLNYLFALVAVGAFGGGVVVLRKKPEKVFVYWLFGAILAVAASVFFFTHITRESYAFPKPHTDFKRVYFETEHSDFELPLSKLVDKHPKNYHTFYVWTQRLDLVPVLKKSYANALEEDGALVILINPTKPFTTGEIEQTVRFVEKGGRLLVLDGPQNKNSTSQQLLEPFGIQTNFAETFSSTLYNQNKEAIGTSQKSGTVSGGMPFLASKHGKTVFSVSQKGNGAVGVMANSAILANPIMGGTQIKPNRKQQKIYDVEFYMIEVMEKYGN